jgi:hypothetical protein
MLTEVNPLKLASRWMYECYVCKRVGIEGVKVYLDGKDSEGRTKYLNTDMTPHTHQSIAAKDHQQSPQKQSKEEVISFSSLNLTALGSR